MTCRLRNDWESVLFLCFQEFNGAYQSLKVGCLGRSVMQIVMQRWKHEFRGKIRGGFCKLKREGREHWEHSFPSQSHHLVTRTTRAFLISMVI